MSVNSTCSKSQNGEVQSKYFVDCKDNTDDSVSEFQEPKKYVKGPQKVKVAPKPKSKTTKKTTKRPRGQKDIRTALSKKNDLIAYSKDFDTVCKQSGLDVDAEQLQLAIALSKSLQNTEEKSETSSESSQPSTSQERVGKIRRTLQQYGFKVPEVKINAGGSKRGRKIRKESKLLLLTAAERQQCIADKYSQVLLDNVVECQVIESERNEDTLYHIATNLSYEAIKDNKVFYVKELLDDTTSTIGSLLREWSKIPGRPLSPAKKSAKVKFDKMNLSPEEVDTFLSGSVAEAQDILRSKKVELEIEVLLDGNSNNALEMQEIIKKPFTETDNVPQTQVRSYSPDLFDDELSSIDNTKETVSSQRSQNSYSQPDYQKSVPNVTRRKTNDFMDLTECVDVFTLPPIARNSIVVSTYEPQIINSASNSQKSDDLMELTECLVANSQTRKHTEDNIDLTQESDDKKECTLVNVPEDETVINLDENIDLTQSDHSDDNTLPLVHISGQKTRSVHEEVNVLHSNLDVDRFLDNSIKYKGTFTDKNPEVHVINSDDELKLTNSKEDNLTFNEEINSSPVKQGSIFEEFAFEHSDHQSSKDTEAKLSDISDNIHPVPEFDNIDLTQNTDSSKQSSVDENVPIIEHNNSRLGKKDDVSVDYDDVYMNETVENIHSIKSRRETQETNENIHNYTLKHSDDISIDYDEVYTIQIEENNCSRHPVHENSENKNLNRETLKPKDALKQIETDRSIQTCVVENNETADDVDDYIDIGNDDVLIHIPFEEAHYTPNKADHSTSVTTPDPSQDVFEISDEELNYSMYKSKHLMSDSQASQEYNLPDNDQGNFDFGGISILDNISCVQNNGRQSLATYLHQSASESYLQSIEVKGAKVKMKSPIKYSSRSEATTPSEELQRNFYSSVQTPNKTEYLIKTHHVTPMSDYASMTTPDRNKELEKYGLKPFKRKRAIQLLTHLYTQTHPVVENYAEEDQPSPSKKRKQDHPPPQTSSNKALEKTPKKSPRKYTKSPAKSCASKNDGEDVFEKDNNDYVNYYDETSSNAVLKDIECSPEDWVFQKRERAKIHSCRVPLHVAIHNYVASRCHLREAILRYEPVNIDMIHKDLVGYGHRYDPKDLLRFLDKKCITVKTADNNGRNNKKS